MTKIKCSWSITRDTFFIQTPHDEFARWFTNICQTHGNDFVPSNFIDDAKHNFVADLVVDLRTKISEVNKFLVKIKEPVLIIPEDLEHQKSLNQLHKQWVRVHRNKPNIDTLMYKVDPFIFESFHGINRTIHVIEHSFVYSMRSANLWQVENPFDMCDDWNEYNISICYTDFGRSSYEKWIVRDDEPNDLELSPWEYIGGSLCIDLNKPRHRTAPPEYLEYCDAYGILPVIPNWPLGNLVDIDNNLGHIRRMFDRNLQIKENKLRFDLD